MLSASRTWKANAGSTRLASGPKNRFRPLSRDCAAGDSAARLFRSRLFHVLDETGSLMKGQCGLNLRLKLTLLGSVALAIIVLGLGGCGNDQRASRAGGPLVPKVVVLTVRKMDLPIIAKTTGTTKALYEVVVRARVKGFLKERAAFKEGANVKKDDLLLVIEEDQFKVRVNQAKAKLDVAQARPGQGQAVEGARGRYQRSSISTKRQAELARVEERRESLLLARNATSRRKLGSPAASRKKSEAQVKVSEANLLQAMSDYRVDIRPLMPT